MDGYQLGSNFESLQQELFDQAMREAQILGLNFQEMERREQIAKQKFREVIEEYLETIYKLHEEKSLQEAADKERINELEVENRRLKAYEDSVTEIQLKFYELKYLLENERKSSEKLTTDYNTVQRELAETKAKYNALKQHSQEKLDDVHNMLIKQKEQFQNDTTVLKAKAVRSDANNQALKQSLEAKEKENKNLMDICQQLLLKAEGRATNVELDTIKQLLSSHF
jgi:hypothetical protein